MSEPEKKNDGRIMYMPLGLCIGLSLGVAIGTAMGNIGVGMCMGLGIGMCFGSALDAAQKAKSDKDSQDASGKQEEGK